jgi:hypothetical protein
MQKVLSRTPLEKENTAEDPDFPAKLAAFRYRWVRPHHFVAGHDRGARYLPDCAEY